MRCELFDVVSPTQGCQAPKSLCKKTQGIEELNDLCCSEIWKYLLPEIALWGI